MATKKGLGRGLDALFDSYSFTDNEIKSNESAGEKSAIQEVNILSIDPNPNQARKDFDKDKLSELANSIKQHGLVQPIIVKKVGNRYMIVAGERRWRAAKEAGFNNVPVISMDLSEKEITEISLVENLQREDLNPIEEAMGIKSLIDAYDLTQDEASERLGRSRSAITNSLRLLNLSARLQAYLADDKLSSGHARALLSIDDLDLREKVADVIIKKALSVRETENLIKKIKMGSKENKAKVKEQRKPSYIIELESKLEDSLGTKVQITPGTKKGVIEIEYYSNEDLERILDRVAH